ncbi:MAG TPA: superoxide dismutase family protein [Rhodocyclaceae bacterium]|nr:superoxide dismutase family protein [Rhodocyclaceae bacterium]
MNSIRSSSLALTAILIAAMTGCASTPTAKPDAVAVLAPASGSQVTGTVAFRAIPGGLHLEATVEGLTAGPHGFHIHEVGDCSAPDATSAKGHFNPYAKTHGEHMDMNHHAGDMPNLVADANGKATWATDLQGVTLTPGDGNVLGRSVVIHADPDDYKTQPAGNSGKRIACGVIKAD